VHEFYFRNGLLSLTLALAAINSDIYIPHFTRLTLHIILKKINSVHERRGNTATLIKRDDSVVDIINTSER
jgi:hypothetical protein